jgi:hypothetical protein
MAFALPLAIFLLLLLNCDGAGPCQDVDCTNYIQNKINMCPAGGEVVLDAGTYMVRPITLKSNMTFRLLANAKLVGIEVSHIICECSNEHRTLPTGRTLFRCQRIL